MHSILPSDPLTRTLHRIVGFFAVACGWWLMFLSAMTCVEMLGRKVFGFSLQGVDEIGSYTFAVVGTFGFSYALLTRGHTRVDFLISRFSGTKRAVLNFTAMVTLAAMALFFVYRAFEVVSESRDLGSTAATPLATPLWIPQAIWLLAYIVFAVTSLTATGYAIALLVRGALAELNRRYGPQTLEEEIESESTVHLAKPARADGEAVP
jgi:TRAP-type mannitol/chloroaromatic compound transport system permease small subunit